MAGGQAAVFKAREGVEDRYDEGARTVSRLRPSRRDVFVGVSASGITPFVRGGLAAARNAGARIIFVTCDPAADLQTFVDLTIALGVGPEVIAGSTRLKAGKRHEARAEHADDGRDDPDRQDVRQPDGGRAAHVGEAEGPRAAHPDDRHGPRLRRRRQVAASARTGT